MRVQSVLMSFAQLAVASCAEQVEVVRKDAWGGELLLHGAYMPAEMAAREAMLDHCQGHFGTTERLARAVPRTVIVDYTCAPARQPAAMPVKTLAAQPPCQTEKVGFGI